ncbi:hypothetical protein [Elizabethkingia phage TCUEAP2]|nr:hypothetical protein [Elizabethkingia phage TCUEAP2]
MKKHDSEFDDLTPQERRVLTLIVLGVGVGIILFFAAICFFIWAVSIKN